jgi:hypothetical protein
MGGEERRGGVSQMVNGFWSSLVGGVTTKP